MADTRSDGHSQPSVTLKTIAEITGLHPSTVARALKREGSADATAIRVREVASSLGYRPDFAAASLRTRRSEAIGVLVHHLTDHVQSYLYEAIDAAALAFNYQTLVAVTKDDAREQRRRVDLMLARRIDGLILADAHTDGEYADWVATLGVPFVLALRRSGDHPSVTVDDELGGRLAGAHLAELGHQRVGILAGLPFSSAFVGRSQGCRDALKERGVEVPDALFIPSGLARDEIEQAVERMLEHEPSMTAVFAADDTLAVHVMGVLRRRQLRPGVDMAIIGYNDMPVAESIGLSSVHSPNAQMGSLAMRMLHDVLSGMRPESIQLAPRLIVRETSAPPRT